MGVDTPIYGFLADYFSVQSDSAVPLADFIHPRVEAEIGVILRKTLRSPGCTVADALSAIDVAMPAIEIIDSRYESFRFDLKSVIADNASSSRFVVGGNACDVRELDLRTLGASIEKNGQGVAFGAGAAVLGNPALSVAMLANILAERDEEVAAGTFIMAGGITEAIAVEAEDHVTARVQHLGSVSVRFQ